MTNGLAPQDIPGAFVDAWNRHDMPALAALFAADANFVNVVGVWWKNREEIETAHAATHATFFRESHLEGEIAAATSLGSGVIALHFLWQLSRLNGPEGEPIPPRRGILLFVLNETAEGSWQIKVAQNTDIVEGAMVPKPAD